MNTSRRALEPSTADQRAADDIVGDLDRLIGAMEACFGELRVLGDALHQHVGISTAMRAVMEHIKREGPATVPDIARAKAVSRQNIQVLVDALAKHGLARMRSNPAHKRSFLVALTNVGALTFERIRQRERALLKDLGGGHSAHSLGVALQVLSRLQRDLEAHRTDGQPPGTQPPGTQPSGTQPSGRARK